MKKIIKFFCPYAIVWLYHRIKEYISIKNKKAMIQDTLDKYKIYERDVDDRKLQLGSGSNHIPGWFNTDIISNSKQCIYHLDFKNSLPFKDNTFAYIFSEHSIEHISFNDASFLLSECFRVLKHNGKIRIATPDLNKLINFYCNNSHLYDKYANFEYDNFIRSKISVDINTKNIILNNFFKDWGHQFIYDFNTLKQLLEKTGFINIERFEIGISNDFQLCHLEKHGKHISDEFNELETMVIEGTKA